MTPVRAAEKYLREHGAYVRALKQLLNDLEEARRHGERADCGFLCDVMIELQLLAGNFEGARDWRCKIHDYEYQRWNSRTRSAPADTPREESEIPAGLLLEAAC